MTIEKKSGVLVIQNATVNHSSVRFATRGSTWRDWSFYAPALAVLASAGVCNAAFAAVLKYKR
jgi:hypothetical protein